MGVCETLVEVYRASTLALNIPLERKPTQWNRASASGSVFNLSSDRGTISFLSEPSSRRDEKVFKLSKHQFHSNAKRSYLDSCIWDNI